MAVAKNFQWSGSMPAVYSKIPSLLASKGYPTASIDSMAYTDTAAHIYLYAGKNITGLKSIRLVSIKRPWMKGLFREKLLQ
jgi:hypothetical protein